MSSHTGTYDSTKEVKQEAHASKDGKYIIINDYENHELRTHLTLPVETAGALAF